MDMEFLKVGLQVWLFFYIGVYIAKLIFLIVQLDEKEIETRLQFLYWALPLGGLVYLVVSSILLLSFLI